MYVIARLSKKGVPLPIVMCQKFKITWFPVIFPFLWTHGLHQFKKIQKILIFSIGASRLKFYYMIYYIAILVQSLRLKKSMKKLDYPSNFWNKV